MDNDPQYRTPDGSALRIWRDSVQNSYLTETHGRPIFDEIIFVEVISPGSRGSTPVFEVKRIFAAEMSRAEPLYGMQYDQFKDFIKDFEKNEEADANLTGTPLKEWSEISRTMAASLKASNIFSVEALSELSDEKLSVVGPDGRSWREKAKAFLAASKDSSYATQLAAELARRDDEISSLRDELKKLSDANTTLAAQVAAGTKAKPEKKDTAAAQEPSPNQNGLSAII